MTTKLEQQIDKALAVLKAQTRPHVHIVRPAKRRGGKGRLPVTAVRHPSSFRVGDRVQAHPATDTWMRGDRYGNVVKVLRTGTVLVKFDASTKVKRMHPRNLIYVEGILFGGRGGKKRAVGGWRATVYAKPGKLLLGGVKRVSGSFASRREAQAWVDAMRDQPNAQRTAHVTAPSTVHRVKR